MNRVLETRVAVNPQAKLSILIKEAGLQCAEMKMAKRADDLWGYKKYPMYSASLLVTPLSTLIAENEELVFAKVTPLMDHFYVFFASLRELMAFAKAHPDEPKDQPIFAGGSLVAGSLAPFIEKSRSTRYLKFFELRKMKGKEWRCLLRNYKELVPSEEAVN